MSDKEATVNLISKEGDVFEVEQSVGLMSGLVKKTLFEEKNVDTNVDADKDNNVQIGTCSTNTNHPNIPLPDVSANTLAKVIEYCKHYQCVEQMTPITIPIKSGKVEDLVQPWYVEYVKVERTVLFNLAAAAKSMDIKPLLDLTCFALATCMLGKSAAELHTMFGLSSKLTTKGEEKKEIKCAPTPTPTPTYTSIGNTTTKTATETASTTSSMTLLDPIKNYDTKKATTTIHNICCCLRLCSFWRKAQNH